MKLLEVETKVSNMKGRLMSPPPPPPPPPPNYWITIKPTAKASTHSVTKQEIEKFWKRKRMEEEDHLLAALKAAARIRARNFTEEDYRRFEESLKDTNKEDNTTSKDENNKEIRVGIKDWWTRSKYAYLNQPAIECADTPKRTSTYIPNFCFCKAPSPQPTSLGVF